MTKRWTVLLASLSAAAGVVVLALFLAGVFDGEGSATPRADGAESAARCTEEEPDCEDMLDATDSAGDDGDGITSAPVCAPGFPDCVDMVVLDGDEPVEGGIDIEPLCAADVPDCADTLVSGDTDGARPPADPLVPADGQCSGDYFASCEQQAINAVLAAAERLFGVDESEIEVEDAAFQEWSNACLDAADEGEACAEVITPGFVIVIVLEGSQHEYHTDLNGNARRAV